MISPTTSGYRCLFLCIIQFEVKEEPLWFDHLARKDDHSNCIEGSQAQNSLSLIKNICHRNTVFHSSIN